jgi:hypothetical protein
MNIPFFRFAKQSNKKKRKTVGFKKKSNLKLSSLREKRENLEHNHERADYKREGILGLERLRVPVGLCW